MNITEANQTQLVLAWVLHDDRDGAGIPTDRQALDALAALAHRANKALSAGTTGRAVRERWAELAQHDPAERRCRVCGCTDSRACLDDDGDPCSWSPDDVEDGDICTRCAGRPVVDVPTGGLL